MKETDYTLEGEDAVVQNAADASQVKAATKKARSLRTRQLEDWKLILDNPRAERVFEAILEQCGHFASPLGKDTHMTYLNIGRAEVGRFILAQMNDANPDALLHIEQRRRAKRRG